VPFVASEAGILAFVELVDLVATWHRPVAESWAAGLFHLLAG
jgi:hypothetical protein